MKFLADADLDVRIIQAVCRREPAVDFQYAFSANLTGKSDLEVLGIAASSGRVLVTHDGQTMPAAFAEFLASRQSPGVLLAPRKLGIGPSADQILLVWSASADEEWINRIVYLPL